ncbi:MAG: nucleotidyl transferase AbiEii/AbiGii toxin family protein [Candidatus Roizmanbacteria bacterium]|nr:nucleotidyl transferase AbiEii/AbiGii toxin family protein [Candidatus Roizmanbacteria bacterium]
MSEQVLTVLKSKLDGLSAFGYSITDPETRLNALKEELQFYVLDFIYHHPDYNKWIMYGGSALRICYDLDRMSVDLDFEVSHKVDDDFLNELKEEAERHFAKVYGIDSEFLKISITNNRGITLKFRAGSLIEGYASEWVHVKVDLNKFAPPGGVVTERMPQNHGQLSFVIRTYNLSSLMASKVAAIFLRGTRGVGVATYEEKGRDIYDLLWYMNKKIVPDLDYLKAKKVDEAKNYQTLFTKLAVKMNNVSDENLKNDLSPLFLDPRYVTNWLANWRDTFFRLREAYKIRTVSKYVGVEVFEDFRTSVSSFIFEYSTKEGDHVRIICNLSEYWFLFKDIEVSFPINNIVSDTIKFSSNGSSSRPTSEKKQKEYASLFYEKIEAYLKKIHHELVGDTLTTKLIRVTADNLNQKEQIVLRKEDLYEGDFDDWLK